MMTNQSQPSRKYSGFSAQTALLLILVCVFACAFAPALAAQTIRVDATPDHLTNTFSPTRALGAGIDRLPQGATDKLFVESTIDKVLSAGWQTVSDRQNTELHIEAWHWNPQGVWSNAAKQEGYFVGSAEPGPEPIKHSWAYPLPHRGTTRGSGQAWSKLTDGDPSTYWKRNPYLTKDFTGEA